MSSSHLLDPYVMAILAEKDHSYLDIGGGFGKWAYLLKISHKPPSTIIGGDVDIEALNFVKKHRTYDDQILFDGRMIPLRDNSFDIVLCLEVIEHLEKSESYLILKEAERVGKKKVIVSTPLLGANYWYKDDYHVSKWTPQDLRRKGYKVRGVGFSFFGRYTTEKLAFGLAPLAFFFPWLSFILLAWKEL